MLETYKAILRGNKIKWDGEAPEISKAEQNVSVYIKNFGRKQFASRRKGSRTKNVGSTGETCIKRCFG